MEYFVNFLLASGGGMWDKVRSFGEGIAKRCATHIVLHRWWEMTNRTYTTNMTERTNRPAEPLLCAGCSATRCPTGLVCPVSPLCRVGLVCLVSFLIIGNVAK